jgi:hypothetical protein
MNDFLDPTVWAVLFLLLSGLALILLTRLYGGRDTTPRTREIAAFEGLRDELGRAAESGRPLHLALGSGELGGANTVSSLAGLQVLEALVDAAVSYGTAPIITVGDPTLLVLAQDVLRRAYERSQIPEFYDATQVRFVAPSSLAYSAGAIPVGTPEDLTATVMAGTFGSEVSLLADISGRRSEPKMAAVDAAQAIGALYPATDRLAVGEELYAAGAQITKQRKYVTSLATEDVLRFVLALAILGVAVLALIAG